MSKFRRPAILLFLLLTLYALEARSQQTQSADNSKSGNYGFLSPNTQENLKLEEAIRKMSSAEEASLVKRIIAFTCVVKTKIVPMRALGSWSDGAENSVLVRIHTDESTVRYLLARLGREAHQKSVLYFHPTPRGDAILYALKSRKGIVNLPKLAGTLERAGITFRTLVPVQRNTIVYIVDLKRDMYPKVRVAATRLGATVGSERGSAQFIGDDSSAEKAQTVYAQEIADYESKHAALPATCEQGAKK